MRYDSSSHPVIFPMAYDSGMGRELELSLGTRLDTGLDTRLDECAIAIGRDLFARVRREGESEGWLDRLMMGAAMGDDQVKAQMFRLVDVLPVLRTSKQVNEHLREYLGSVRDRLPWAVAEAMDFLPVDGLLGGLMATATLWGTRRMARRFIAASDGPEAVRAVRKLRKKGLTFTIDVLGEAVLSAAEARAYQAFYLELIEALADEAAGWEEDAVLDRDHRGAIPKVNVSVKLSSLFSQFDPIDPEGTSRAVRERLRPILRLAKQRGVLINVDMEQYSFKDATLWIFREVLEEEEFRDWGDVGIAIQAYLKDTGEDLRKLADWARARGTAVWVRLVKGAYWDYETVIARQNDWPVPVWGKKPATDANYEAQTRFLLENADVLRPAIASHNIRSIAHALAVAEELKLAPGAVEFQLLYGMADPIKAALVKMGRRVRVYAPVGKLLPGMAYLVRRLLENTSNESFLRAGFLDHVPEERLLMNPMKLMQKKSATDEHRLAQIRKENGLYLCSSVPICGSTFLNEALADFSREEAREAMKEALAKITGELGRDYALVIGGKRVMSGEWIESVDPSHKLRVVGRCAAATVEQPRLAISAAKEAFESWREVSWEGRAAWLVRVGAILRRRRFEMAAWQVTETGKPWREADGDVAEAIDYCDYYAQQAIALGQGWRRDLPGEENLNVYEPRGVAAIIAPWNFPLAILLGMTVSAVVTGNTAIMKPAEQSSVVGAKLMEVFEEAGLPAGVVNYLPGYGEEIGPALTGSPEVSIIAFTGSRAVGLMIQEQTGKSPAGQDHIKRVITEMGGKNAVIVDEDADLDEAVAGIVSAAFGYAGQKCSACSRAIVLAGVYETFVTRLAEAAASIKVGPAEDAGSFYGPVIDGEAQARILKTIERAKGSGLRVAHAGDVGALAVEGFYVGPHVFADVPADSFLAQEEIFGPVLAVIRAADLDEALKIANGTKYALTGGVYSRSPASIARVRRQFRVGNLYVNRKITGALVERQPFGGFKLSGVGVKAGGPDYLREFVWPRTITENTMRRGFAPEVG